MSNDYVPNSDGGLRDWMTNFLAVLTTHAAQVHLELADLTPLGTAKTDFENAMIDQVSKQAAAEAATGVKNDSRVSMVTLVRAMVRRICGDPGMTNELRLELGLNVPSGERTPNAVGTEVPDLFLEAKPGNVIVHFGTAPGNERVNTKPSWAKGCNIYRKKPGDADYQMIAFETSSPYTDFITGDASNYTYVVRYRGTKASDLGGQSSPMSIAASGELAA